MFDHGGCLPRQQNARARFTRRSTKHAGKPPALAAFVALGLVILPISSAHALSAAQHNSRGISFYDRGEYDQAIAEYDQAIRLKPRDALLYNNRGNAFQLKGEYDKAIVDFDQSIRLNSHSAVPFNGRANTFYLKQQYDKAIADYDQASRIDPTYNAPYNGRANIYKKQGDFDRAIAEYDQAIQLKPKDYNTYYNRANAHLAKKEYNKAIADYDQSIRLEAKNLSAFNNRANAYKEKGDYERSLADYAQAIIVDPNSTFPYNGRGEVLQKQHDLANALIAFNQALRLDPRNTLAYINRARLFAETGEYQRAVDDYEKIIAMGDANSVIYNNAAFDLFRLKAYDKSLRFVEKSIKMDPRNVAAYDTRGSIYRALGKTDAALRDFDEAVRLRPDDAIARFNRGLIWREKGDEERALADLAEAVRLEPGLERNTEFLPIQGEAQPALAARSKAEITVAATQPPVTAPSVSNAMTISESRVALVIGNGGYTAVSPLDTPTKDAQVVASALRKAGFKTVHIKSDLGYDALRRALRDFSAEAREADWAVVYYAGHGIEVGGTNYVVPVDAHLKSDSDVQFEAVALDQLLASIEGARKLRLVILDACRDNPFIQQMTRTIATRSVGRGLAKIEPNDSGTLVAFAAKHGQVALDRQIGQDNSPFATAFVQAMTRPGIEIRRLFGIVRDDVLKGTGRQQEPYVYGSLGGDEYFFTAR